MCAPPCQICKNFFKVRKGLEKIQASSTPMSGYSTSQREWLPKYRSKQQCSNIALLRKASLTTLESELTAEAWTLGPVHCRWECRVLQNYLRLNRVSTRLSVRLLDIYWGQVFLSLSFFLHVSSVCVFLYGPEVDGCLFPSQWPASLFGFYTGLEIQIPVLMLLRKALSPLGHIPNKCLLPL